MSPFLRMFLISSLIHLLLAAAFPNLYPLIFFLPSSARSFLSEKDEVVFDLSSPITCFPRLLCVWALFEKSPNSLPLMYRFALFAIFCLQLQLPRVSKCPFASLSLPFSICLAQFGVRQPIFFGYSCFSRDHLLSFSTELFGFPFCLLGTYSVF